MYGPEHCSRIKKKQKRKNLWEKKGKGGPFTTEEGKYISKRQWREYSDPSESPREETRVVRHKYEVVG